MQKETIGYCETCGLLDHHLQHGQCEICSGKTIVLSPRRTGKTAADNMLRRRVGDKHPAAQDLRTYLEPRA